MTTLTVPARPKEDATLRPVPWRRMAWVTWRQHRAALAGVAVFLGALAVGLWLAGLKTHDVYAAAVAACHPASSLACGNAVTSLIGTNGFLSNGVILQAVPPLIGAFAGAPVLAREMETGTFRYAWTQGFGRWRWTLAKLVPLAVTVTAATGLLSVLLSWYYQPYIAPGNQALGIPGASPFAPGLFDLRGVAFAAWTLAAFAIGALAGMLIRRPPDSVLNRFCSSVPSGPYGKGSSQGFVQCLSQHGYTQWTSYQPASRFWPFQWIEGGWLLALSALLIAAAVWLVRRRAA